MPRVNLSIKCIGCGTEVKTFLCPHCSRYTCSECMLVMDEFGCEHKKKEVVKSHSWDNTLSTRTSSAMLDTESAIMDS